MAQASFFGLTSYGPGTTYDKSSAKPLHFHEVPDDVFVDLFRKHALGESQLAIILQVRFTCVLYIGTDIASQVVLAGSRLNHHAY